MEPQPGMFVLHATDAGWVADPEVPGSEMQELVHEGPLYAGTTRILEADGPGDVATIPAGMTTTWHVTVPVREMWVLAEGA